MDTFTWTPDYSANLSKKPRVNSAKFGDGYSQRVGEGINTNPKMWSVGFTVAPAVGDAIDAFLDTKGGALSFLWTPPRESVARAFICPEWSKSESSYGEVTVNAKFEQVF